MYINVHAGHNPDDMIACGAIGLIKESTEARNVANEVIRQLRLLGHVVNDCTCDNGTSKQDVLNKIIKKCNSHKKPDGTYVDLDVSIHFNSAANDLNGDGKTTGTEVYIFGPTAGAQNYAKNTVDAIANLGFKNRGVKTNVDLRVLKETYAPAMLVECCFVDDADDCKLYNAYKMASAIVKGITGQTYVEPVNTVADDEYFRVQVGAFKKKDNAERLKAELISKGYPAFITK